jgi:rhodanese-related sulfurtransferase
VDLYRYDEAWELDSVEAISQYSKVDHKTSGMVLIDLRKPDDFLSNNVPGSYNLPTQSLTSSTPSPFFDATVLERQWKELDAILSPNTISAYDLSDKNVGVICYDGDTARVATSVLRHKGIAASSIRGGFRALTTQMPQLQTKEPVSFQQWSKSADETVRELAPGALTPPAEPSREALVAAP